MDLKNIPYSKSAKGADNLNPALPSFILIFQLMSTDQPGIKSGKCKFSHE